MIRKIETLDELYMRLRAQGQWFIADGFESAIADSAVHVEAVFLEGKFIGIDGEDREYLEEAHPDSAHLITNPMIEIANPVVYTDSLVYFPNNDSVLCVYRNPRR